MPEVTLMDTIERFWNAIRIHRVEVTPEAKGPESVIDIALERLKSELPRIVEETPTKDLRTSQDFTNAVVEASRILLTSLFKEQQKQDISLMIQLFLEVPGKEPKDIKGFLRTLPRTLIDRILLRMEESKHQCGLQLMLSLEALYRDGRLHQDYEVDKEADNRIQIIFYPKDHGPLRFHLRDVFIG